MGKTSPLQSVKVRLAILVIPFIALMLFYQFGRSVWTPIKVKMMGGKTVAEVVEELGPQARAYWEPLLEEAGRTYPPTSLTLISLKHEEKLEVWDSSNPDAPKLLATFDVLAKSGTLGPKRREHDRQIPEGVYKVPGLNPNSAYHLSIKVDYPNAWDREHANEKDKNSLGGDIFIHGSNVSIGCIAIGNPNIEKLFTLVADSGKKNVEIIIAPFDLRKEYDANLLPQDEEWYAELYEKIEAAMEPYTQSPST